MGILSAYGLRISINLVLSEAIQQITGALHASHTPLRFPVKLTAQFTALFQRVIYF